MNVHKFAVHVVLDAANFAENMQRLAKYQDEDKSPAEWMRLFLKWSEWGTEMQSTYWLEYDDAQL